MQVTVTVAAVDGSAESDIVLTIPVATPVQSSAQVRLGTAQFLSVRAIRQRQGSVWSPSP